jgi:hypothetical protein
VGHRHELDCHRNCEDCVHVQFGRIRDRVAGPEGQFIRRRKYVVERGIRLILMSGFRQEDSVMGHGEDSCERFKGFFC